MLSTTIIATKAPVVFAVAMNNQMYENPIVQYNIEKLKKFNYRFIEPVVGNLACGYIEKGKLADNDKIIEFIKEIVKEIK
ncbi:Coenzyme A biosynthesis bifunctional protein CoaBC [compost metagenome]